MANKKISELNQAQPVSPGDVLPIVQNVNSTQETRKITVSNLLASCSGGGNGSSGGAATAAGGFVENFPLSMAEGAQNINPGFYGVRFTPGADFVAQYAQICKRDVMTSGSFVVAIYSQGVSTSSSRTENMTLLAQTSPATFNGDNGIATAEFSAQQQITLEANKEYYMVLYVQHSADRGLICRRTIANSWGNSNLTLAFKGSSQTVQATLGSSNFSTLFPSASVNDIIMPFMKIYGIADTSSVNNNSRVLVINDGNVAQYFTDTAYGNPINPNTAHDTSDVYAYIPDGYSIIAVETTNRYKIAAIKPLGGIDFKDYKKITFMGSKVDFWQGAYGNNNYGISQYWYTYRHSGGYNFLVEAFTEFILKNKVWYSVYY